MTEQLASSIFDPISEIQSNENELDKSESNLANTSTNLIMKISLYSKEIVLFFAFLLTTFATIQNNSPKVSRSVPPSPFFARDSLIEDYYQGNLNRLNSKIALSELSFVLYYAPWCSTSRHARTAFEQVSRFFYKEAYFGAVNCWEPGSECRRHYSKIISWPILMAFQKNEFGVQYTKNLWTEGALIKFARSMMNPVERFITPDDLLEYVTSRDAAIVAFLDVDYDRIQYQSFQRAALKFLERDPFNEVGFAVVLGHSAVHFGVETIPTIRAYFWNETIEFDAKMPWRSKNILKWVQENIQQVSLHLSPPGTKSTSLAPYIKTGPVMILFTPRNFLFDVSDSYVMLRQLGMEYYNCKQNDWVRELARIYLFRRRKENYENLIKLREKCTEIISYQQESKKCGSGVSTTVSFTNILNASKNFEKSSSFCEIDAKSKCECLAETCSIPIVNFKKTYGASDKYETSMFRGDDRSPDAIDRYNLKRQCEMLRLAERTSDLVFIDDPDTLPLELVSGLACKFNKTFALIAMDSNNFHTFAERLGVDILEMENKTAALIIDQENESTYMLNEPVNLNSLARFIYSYHRNGLDRYLRTNSIQYKHTHFFDINEFLTVKEKERRDVKKDGKDGRVCEAMERKRKDYHVVLREINSEDFEAAVIRANKTVVILFYSTNCAFCSLMSHSLLTVSRILEKIPDIEFLRIDGDKNDLAWHYTMAEYPSLLLFPQKAKAESRKFPSKMQINVSNVLGFILANLSRANRLLGLTLACNYKRPNSLNDCVTAIQEEITDAISHTLREWRKDSRKRSVLLRTIKQLKEIYLKLFRIQKSCDFIEVEKDVMSLIARWQKAIAL